MRQSRVDARRVGEDGVRFRFTSKILPPYQKARKGWRKLNGSAKLQDLIDGVVFVDGERKAARPVGSVHSFWEYLGARFLLTSDL